MNNICTTVEQSKRLLELGLNPLTSDMYWGLKGSLMHPSDEYELNIGRDVAIEHNLFSYRNGYTIPAWSLSALWDINNICGIGPHCFDNGDFPSERLIETLYRWICIELQEDASSVNMELSKEYSLSSDA